MSTRRADKHEPGLTWTVEADQVAHGVGPRSAITLCGLKWQNDGRIPAHRACPDCIELLGGKAA